MTERMESVVPRVELKGIRKSFPGVAALKNVDFTLMPNEVHGLMGENGAGKSVMLKILLGAYQKDAGEIWIDGEKKDISSTFVARREGLSAVYQDLMLAPTLSVAENICLGSLPNKAGLVDFTEMRRQAQAVCDKYGIKLDINKKVRELIVAEQQMVAIAKALAINAKVLVLDEPTAMLTDDETKTLFDAVRRLKKEGVSVIYVSHRMEEIFEICDTVTILRDGEQVGCAKVSEITSEEMIRIMSGRTIEDLYGDRGDVAARLTEQVMLDVSGLTKQKVFQDISFQVRKGEILGFFGLVGSKRTDVMRAIFGVDTYNSGSVVFNNVPLKNGDTQANIKQGIGLVPEERLTQGVCTGLSVGRNVNMADYKKVSSGGIMRQQEEDKIAQKYIELFRVRTPGPRQLVRNLSGGNQQKVAIAKWFNIAPKLVIFDEPTVGVDVGAKLEIYDLIRSFAQDGGSVIMVSSHLPEIMGVCDRVIVMNNGRITGEVICQESTEEQVLNMAFQEI
ncbi:MAG: sugar ABC transporter ATP-binding protein [Oscillospiraceae bacterium]|jgi:ribose transport system ATP-binding protein|nr:sugar ABC transporter ATP-binding protein [Oscillospiraceae bacterium]